MREQLKQWTFSDERPLEMTKIIRLARKVLATIFWDSQGIIFIDYSSEKSKTAVSLIKMTDPTLYVYTYIQATFSVIIQGI